VAAAVICCVAELGPKLTVGLGGSIVMLETVGFWKKPVQLTARAKVASAAMAPAIRSSCFADDIRRFGLLNLASLNLALFESGLAQNHRLSRGKCSSASPSPLFFLRYDDTISIRRRL
jgi:hypothetical protein